MLLQRLRALLDESSGQSLTEFAVLLSLVAVAAVGVVGLFGQGVVSSLTHTLTQLSTAFN